MAFDDTITEFESERAHQAYRDYYDLGAGRSIRKLIDLYLSHPNREEVPSVNLVTLQRWCKDFDWRGRVAEREALIAQKTEDSIIKSRVDRKKERLTALWKTRTICDDILSIMQNRFMELQTGPMEDLIKLLPTVLKGIVVANKEERIELGEEVDRVHITIEQLIEHIPVSPENKMLIRESLLKSIESPNGMADVKPSEPPALAESNL